VIVTTLIVVLLVLLTIAVAVLFAMMGELANRNVDSPTGSVGSGPAVPLEEVRVGLSTSDLPSSFRSGAGVVMVFSTSCRACNKLAPQAAEFFRDYPVNLIGVLVTAGSAASAHDFVAKHDLAALPVEIDLDGQTSREVLGVSSSPAAVAVNDGGVIMSAVAFTSYSSLTSWFDSMFGPALDTARQGKHP
jgi:hypothetical protein